MKYLDRNDRCQPATTRWVDGVLNCLLPMRCLLCGGGCRFDNICPPCLAGLPWNTRACSGCSLPLEGLAGGLCGACMGRRLAWDRVHAPLLYEFPVDRLVQRFKFQGRLDCGRTLARTMREKPLADAILVPVPLHWMRCHSRGFNQSLELASHLARHFGLTLLPRSLLRRRRTMPQTGLDARQRRSNLRNAFRWRGAELAGASVLLIDDVMTTGSTAAACARVLRMAGAGEIEVRVAARAVV